MVDVLSSIVQFLETVYNDPFAFSFVVFWFSVAVAVVLPVPIEAVLIWPILEQRWGYLTGIAIALAAGKTVGAWLVFVLGLHVEGSIRSWSERWRFAAWFVEKAEKFVAKTKVTGLYIILSIPLMPDTITIYLYSLFNPQGQALERNMFLTANFLAALNRIALVVIAFFIFDVALTG